MATTLDPTRDDVPLERARRRPRSLDRWLAVLRTPVGASAGLLLALVLLFAVFAPVIWTHQANAVDTNNILAGPSGSHWVGTDNLGRDLFYRVLVATRLSVGLALLATLIAVVLGLVLGALPVLTGRLAGRAITAAINIAVAFPGLLLALFFAVIFGIGIKGAVLAIGVAGAPTFARLTQTLAAGVAQRDFVAAARIAGAGRIRLLIRHILPNIAEPLVVNATIGAGGALLAFAGLSFLGLGVQAPSYDWGALLQDGLTGIYVHPAGALAPGVAIVIAGLAFNLFGEAVAKGIGLTATIGHLPLRPAASPPAQAPSAPSAEDTDVVLQVQDLTVTLPGANGPLCPVRSVTFEVRRAETVGIVGESGSGKSVTAMAIARLIEEPGQVAAQRLRLLGTDLLAGSARDHRTLLGRSFAMVFQDPTTSFNPTRRVGRQLAEVAAQHQDISRGQAAARAVERLSAVRVPAAGRRARQYPHEFSGGMRQRAMIGMGLMNDPALIIADEPTTALDVTVQRQVLQLLARIRDENGVALVLISHDVAVVRQVCDRVLVMYAGRIVEDLPADELTTGARHPYTRALVTAVPDMNVSVDLPLPVIPGRPVDPGHQPVGCAYAARCPLADQRCLAEDPELVTDAAGRRVACWHAGEPLPDRWQELVTSREALAGREAS
ncbi:dipeptide/oligopeptide/nickel ABC transporter permease/ATP-binding protein [Allobranchiibius huperziae]|uniref:Oligopeptide/dipeptide ABC transporter ATP-binding protein n=1 Tax=Allobranchiibius huperziae TaxID=1874116 RepID=A0A853DFU4_9MICO|nr:dipeptide/oligopeptide/nickel ABC transporter permease/ATP-binding protein [Allobranchiibius huperziae]NYJ74903.1 oligopeptide/dipeptide ABC transporter ATP-binding protein [Allobranchiibius huperziae]